MKSLLVMLAVVLWGCEPPEPRGRAENRVVRAYERYAQTGDTKLLEDVKEVGDAALAEWVEAMLHGDCGVWAAPSPSQAVEIHVSFLASNLLDVLDCKSDPQDPAVVKTLDPLVRALKSRDFELRRRAVTALSLLGRPQAEKIGPALVRLLQSSEPGETQIAALALVELGVSMRAVAPVVEDLLTDDRAVVRIAAAYFLSEIGHSLDQLREAMMRTLKEDGIPRELRGSAEEVLRRIELAAELTQGPTADTDVPLGEGADRASGRYMGVQEDDDGQYQMILALRPDQTFTIWLRPISIFLPVERLTREVQSGSWSALQGSIALSSTSHQGSEVGNHPRTVLTRREDGVLVGRKVSLRLNPPHASSTDK